MLLSLFCCERSQRSETIDSRHPAVALSLSLPKCKVCSTCFDFIAQMHKITFHSQVVKQTIIWRSTAVGHVVSVGSCRMIVDLFVPRSRTFPGKRRKASLSPCVQGHKDKCRENTELKGKRMGYAHVRGRWEDLAYLGSVRAGLIQAVSACEERRGRSQAVLTSTTDGREIPA